MHKKRVGIIGCGYWGSILICNFNNHADVDVTSVCDPDQELLNNIKPLYPKIKTTKRFEEITQDKDIDAVVIATPASIHFPIALDALTYGKDVFCEKPLTMKSEESKELINIAKINKCILMVGHVFLFNPGIIKLKEIIKSGEHGNDFFYMLSQRTNLGPVRNDVNVVHDLASHDISIFNFLFESIPKVLSALGVSSLQNDLEDAAFITLEYPSNIIVQVYVSWMHFPKVRKISLIGDKKTVLWDDLSPDSSLQLFLEKKMESVFIEKIEPLKIEVDHFIKCIQNRQTPVCDGENGYNVVKVLEEINLIIASQRKNKLLA